VRAELAALALALGVTTAGCFDGPTLADEPCPPGGTSLTYADFAAPFFGEWCARCHAADATDRHGAPHDITFDDPGEIRARAARIFERAAASNVSMPPGLDDPPPEAREQLAEWLACGAP
jgi:uncharacterized membrane protein